MKPHPRPPIIRKTIKWGGAAVTVLLVVVWIGSARYGVIYSNSSCNSWRLFAGLLVFEGYNNPPGTCQAGWDTFAVDWSLWWLQFALRHEEDGFFAAAVQLWPIVGASMLSTVFAWHLDTLARRRTRLNLCSKCNYDRAGIGVDAVCPECGSKGGQA